MALALIPCVIVAYIIKEREMQVKHMQVISGVSLGAYWWSNLISDIFKCYVPIAIILLMDFIFNLDYEGVYILLLLYPISIVPWTYLTSYLFKRDLQAQIMTVFVHFFFGGIIPVAIYTL